MHNLVTISNGRVPRSYVDTAYLESLACRAGEEGQTCAGLDWCSTHSEAITPNYT